MNSFDVDAFPIASARERISEKEQMCHWINFNQEFVFDEQEKK